MNKTFKTIAWVCLALGLLGTAVDASLLVYGRKLVGERQTAFGELQAEVQPENSMMTKNTCIAEDADKDGKPDGDCLDYQAPGQPGRPGKGGQPIRRGMMLNVRNNLGGRRINEFAILPLFFMALGPILAVVGAVILLVNREPKAAAVKERSKRDKEK